MDFLLHAGGALFLAAGGGWLLLVLQARPGDATQVAIVLGLGVASYVVSRVMTRYNDWICALLVALGAAGFAAHRFDVLFDGPIGGPLGYSNAAGSLYMLAAGAAMIVAVRVHGLIPRVAAASLAVALAAVPWLNATTTAAALVCLLPLGLLGTSVLRVRTTIAVGAGAVVATLLLVVLLGATYQPGTANSLHSLANSTLTERRVMLWHDAIELLRVEPLGGVGPGQFPQRSPTAQADRDTPWPHNEVLHFGAEVGFPGVLLMLGLFAWGFARLWWGGGDRGTALAAIALAAVGVHANVDYILHFPAVVVAAVAIVGAGSRGRPPPLERPHRAEPPARSSRLSTLFVRPG